jgi:hypothetical protein
MMVFALFLAINWMAMFRQHPEWTERPPSILRGSALKSFGQAPSPFMPMQKLVLTTMGPSKV